MSIERQFIEDAIAEARRRGCRAPTTTEQVTRGIQEWLTDVNAEGARFGESAGPPPWNLALWDDLNPAQPCLCVFEIIWPGDEVELLFFVIERNSRAVVNWCDNAPGDVDAARRDFGARWGTTHRSGPGVAG